MRIDHLTIANFSLQVIEREIIMEYLCPFKIPEKILKSTVYHPAETTYITPGVKAVDQDSDELEPLPLHLIPKSASYK